MSDWVTVLQSMSWGAALRIAVAAVLGAVIGLERSRGAHPAGLRTNMLIAVSACLFTILSIEGFPLKGASQDTARVAAGIVAGVGFLGAGVLIRTRSNVQGLTTAATIWLVAAVGMAVGAGAFFLAVFTVLISMFVLVVLAPVSRRLEERAGEDKDSRDS